MEYVSNMTGAAGGCVSYPWRWPLVSNPYPLEAGNPYRELQREMEHIPYIEPYGYGWCFPWWGIYPPFFMCPEYDGRVYTWTDSAGGLRNA